MGYLIESNIEVKKAVILPADILGCGTNPSTVIKDINSYPLYMAAPELLLMILELEQFLHFKVLLVEMIFLWLQGITYK